MVKNKKITSLILMLFGIATLITIIIASQSSYANTSNSSVVVSIIPINYIKMSENTSKTVQDNSFLGKITQFMNSLRNKHKKLTMSIIATAMIVVLIIIAILIESMHRKERHASLTSLLHIENEKELERKI